GDDDADNPAAGTVKIIMPLSVSCAGRGDECTTADVAAPYLAASMDTYGIKTGYEQAGILALISYESNQLQYKTNLNPANKAAGQGTANEQSGQFNVEYANSFPELASMNLTTSTVLAQVTQDKYNFGSGAWFYSQQKTDGCKNARAMAQQSNTTAWEWFSTVYLADCVGVNITAQTARTEDWNRALQAFGISNNTVNGVSTTK
ncbi:hypothetical protein N0V82_007803, partial [Gnomoniopsis sp. IMI 355080]